MSTSDLWTYSETAWGQGKTTTAGTQGADVSGFSVEASDGSIGKVDEATYDVGASYVVVDTGPWIFGKKVMLPAGVIKSVDHDNENVFVNRTKDEIKNAPEFDRDMHLGDEEYHNRLGSYYAGSDTSRSDF
jgi:hypothetical protein